MRSVICRLAALLALFALLLSGCSTASGPPEETPEEETGYVAPTAHHPGTAYEEEDYGFQLQPPAAGEEIAILSTTFGRIGIRLFPKGAPKTVANFKALIERGYYDGLSFHRIIKDFMIQTGDPNGDGSGGAAADGKDIPDEFDEKLLNLRGALAMANPGVEDRNGSQFFINQTAQNLYAEESCRQSLESYKQNYEGLVSSCREYFEYYEEQLGSFYSDWETFFHANYPVAPLPDTVPEEVWDLYNAHGGNVYLDGAWRNYGGHTVFGQVFDGMEVVDAIASVTTDENDAPAYEVIIKKAEIALYDPETYEKSVLLSPLLIPVKPDDTGGNGDGPAIPLTEAQLSTEHPIGDAYPEAAYGFQLEPPTKGEEIAVLHTEQGDVYIRLFPEGAPQTVARFKELIRAGAYSGKTFGYVMEDFIVQVEAGAAGAVDSYLPDEFDRHLLNLRGAVSMGNSGLQNSGTAEFFINQTNPGSETLDKAYWEENEREYESFYDTAKAQYAAYYTEHEDILKAYYNSMDLYFAVNLTLAPRPKWVPEAVWELYGRQGGNIHLDAQWRSYGGNTVFGQVFRGMDAVDSIAAGTTDENGVPASPVVILSAEIVNYE